MEQRQAVRIPVQLRARLLHEEGRPARPAAAVAYQRRPTTDHEIVCSCSSAGHHGPREPHPLGWLEGGAMPITIDGTVDDLSRNGLFLRTPQTLPPGTETTVCLELPEEQVMLRGEVVRVERGRRTGLGLQFSREQQDRRLLVNYLMRCHAHGA